MQDVSSFLLSRVHTITGRESREQSETKYSFQIDRPAAAALSPDRLSLLSSSMSLYHVRQIRQLNHRLETHGISCKGKLSRVAGER